MKIKEIDINKLIPYHNNPRKNQAIDKVASSIKEYGFQQPIVVDKDMVLIVGHTRLAGAKKLGLEKVPVQIADLSESKAKAYRIADNRLNEDSTWDLDLLDLEVKSLLEENYNIDLLGFDSSEIDKFLKNDNQYLTDEDEVPEPPKKPKSKLGDIYELGEHKLMCGDSTDEESVKKLLNNKKIEMSFIDPPYGLNYEYNSYKDIEGAEYLAFCDKWFLLLEKYSKFNFITAGWKYNRYWIKKEPKDIFYWISRNKQTGGKLSHFRKIEPIFLFGSLPKKVRYDLDYFDFNTDREDGLRDLHTCPKPVKFVESAIKVITKKNVLDLFLGSGTSLIACENLNKNCFGMEKDPKYCDVIVQRWENYTGKKAKLVNG
tara:strand:+ start:756 stop:1874 length:1119 start_codon:yes stop_codon:yes gene_type:complete